MCNTLSGSRKYVYMLVWRDPPRGWIGSCGANLCEDEWLQTGSMMQSSPLWGQINANRLVTGVYSPLQGGVYAYMFVRMLVLSCPLQGWIYAHCGMTMCGTSRLWTWNYSAPLLRRASAVSSLQDLRLENSAIRLCKVSLCFIKNVTSAPGRTLVPLISRPTWVYRCPEGHKIFQMSRWLEGTVGDRPHRCRTRASVKWTVSGVKPIASATEFESHHGYKRDRLLDELWSGVTVTNHDTSVCTIFVLQLSISTDPIVRTMSLFLRTDAVRVAGWAYCSFLLGLLIMLSLMLWYICC